MDVYKLMGGMVRVELTSANIPAAYIRFADAGIEIWDVEQRDELVICFCVTRTQFNQLRAICDKYGDMIKPLRRDGLYWRLKSIWKRPVLLFGLVFLMALVAYLPGRIFFVEIDGNHSVPSRLILEAAENSGICFGASRREVRSERVKNALLEAVPQLQWAGVNTYGCVAKISVRERSKTEEFSVQGGYGNVVALRDGVITDCTATRGNLLCKVGQAVTEGEVLISGYTDCGICIRVEQAQGEIFARTIRNASVLTPRKYTRRSGEPELHYKISLLIGKKRINLWKDSGISEASCGRMYEEYYIILPGGFRLPAALVVETFSTWSYRESSLSDMDAEALLAPFAENYLAQQMVAGSIRSAETRITENEGCFCLDGQYVCVEMIGSMQREQIGENDGKTG